MKKHQMKVKELKLQNEQLELKLSALRGKRGDEKGSNAGDAFGGRASMRKPT